MSGPGFLLFEQPRLPMSHTVISKVLAQSRRAKMNLQAARTLKIPHFNYTHLKMEIHKNGTGRGGKSHCKMFPRNDVLGAFIS